MDKTEPSAGTRVVGHYTHLYEAQIAQAFLSAHDIQATVQGHYSMSTSWLYANALDGGIRLVVAAGDAEVAQTLLQKKARELTLVDAEHVAEPSPRWSKTHRLVLFILLLVLTGSWLAHFRL